MNRIVPLLLISFIVFSCGPKDRNISLVTKEFNKYVQNSFDDPKMLKEIVEIAPNDTISLLKIKSMVAMSDSLIDATRELHILKDSLGNAKLEEQYEVLRKSRNISYSDAFTGQLLVIDVMSTLQKIIELKKTLVIQQESLNKLCDSLKYKPALYIYSVKYRKQYPEGLKLETVYAYVDSLSGFKSISTARKDSEMMSPEYEAVFERSKDCMMTLSNLNNLYQKQDEQIEEFDKFFQRVK